MSKQSVLNEVLAEQPATRHWHIWWIRPSGGCATMSRAYTSRNRANYAARDNSVRYRIVWECRLGDQCPHKPERGQR